MKTDVELSEEEVKEAVAFYLREKKDVKCDPENVSLEVASGGSPRDPRVSSGPRFRKAKCEDVET
jgi:hypothetical protein